MIFPRFFPFDCARQVCRAVDIFFFGRPGISRCLLPPSDLNRPVRRPRSWTFERTVLLPLFYAESLSAPLNRVYGRQSAQIRAQVCSQAGHSDVLALFSALI
jgi:hypothetical protein